MCLRTAALRPLIDWPRPLDHIPVVLTHFVIAGHSALKTRVNALMTRQSILLAKSSCEE
jgi:hypothetical protein